MRGVFEVADNIINLMKQYVQEIQKIYGSHLRQIILYGSYARGDYREDSDIDIMILLDISDLEIKDYFEQLVNMTFDFNMYYDTDIKPIAKSEEHFKKWVLNYPFYANIKKEGVILYGAA
jgi:predicted nucleotidyltransferase